MDRQFLEFLGNFLINAAKGQKQIEDMGKWIGQDLKGVEDLTAMFRKFYELDRFSEDSLDYQKNWKRAEKDFQKSLQDYLTLFGFVPKQEYLALVRKTEELREKVAEQEETIKHLRMLLGEKGYNQGEVTRGFQELIKKQTYQFQEFMKGFAQSSEKDSPSNDGE